MKLDHITSAFALLIEEFERELHESLRLGAEAFAKRDYERVESIMRRAKALEDRRQDAVATFPACESRVKPIP